jgi:carbamate kinase
VVAGFQGVDEHGNITTLDRGGSDTTAVALAAALKADECHIYTDVDGVYTPSLARQWIIKHPFLWKQVAVVFAWLNRLSDWFLHSSLKPQQPAVLRWVEKVEDGLIWLGQGVPIRKIWMPH